MNYEERLREMDHRFHRQELTTAIEMAAISLALLVTSGWTCWVAADAYSHGDAVIVPMGLVALGCGALAVKLAFFARTCWRDYWAGCASRL